MDPNGNTTPERPASLLLAAVTTVLAALILQIPTVLNWFAVRAAERDALAAYPDEAVFVDNWAGSAYSITALTGFGSLVLGVWLMIRALVALARNRGKPWPVVLVATILWVVCAGVVHPLSGLMEGDPDGYSLANGYFPGWHGPILGGCVVAVLVLCAIALAAVIGWRAGIRRAGPDAAPAA